MRAIVGFFLLLLGVAPAMAAERVALLIGNAVYAHESTLANPPNDVAAMAERLDALGFDVEVLHDADRRTLGKAMKQFRERARRADTAVIFYSGHGMEIGGRNYLIPIDAALRDEADADLDAIELNQALFAAARASRLSVVIVDACRNNRFPGWMRAGARGFAPVRAQSGQVVAFAAAPGQLAADGDDRLSPFTTALSEVLDRPDVGFLDVRMLFGGLGLRVNELTGGAQDPHMTSQGFGTAIVTLTGEETATIDTKTVPAPPGPATTRIAYETLGETGVRSAQRALRNIGLYHGAIDGIWGPQSERALAAFHKREGQASRRGPMSADELDWLLAASAEARINPSGQPDLAAFTDCDDCPAMVILPAGRYRRGSPESETGHDPNEGPVASVSIGRFAIGRNEVTYAEWAACVADGGCEGYNPDQLPGAAGRMPLVYVSWVAAQSYVAWLNRKAGAAVYRLPSEAEWEYAARAGTSGPYPWGAEAVRDFANYGLETCCGGAAGGLDLWVGTSPVRSFPPNGFGLYDMHGNAMEWVQDCWNESYAGAPDDGSAWMSGDCSLAVVRGGAWMTPPALMRSADRAWMARSGGFNAHGFRVARDL